MVAQPVSRDNHLAESDDGRLLERLAQSIEQDTMELPMLPDVAQNVLTITRSPNPDPRKLSKLIQRDVALAGHVLRIANSPAYMPSTPIVSLQQAVMRLGINSIGEIATMVSIASRCFDVPAFETELESMWKSSLCLAGWSKEIARHRRRNVETVFLCGLLADIGRPIVLQAISDLGVELGVPVTKETARKAISEHYRVVGTRVAEAWKLPDAVLAAIKHRSEPEEAGAHEDTTRTVAGGVVFARHHLSPEGYVEDRVRKSKTIAELNLYPDDIDAIFEKKASVELFMEAMGR